MCASIHTQHSHMETLTRLISNLEMVLLPLWTIISHIVKIIFLPQTAHTHTHIYIYILKAEINSLKMMPSNQQ